MFPLPVTFCRKLAADHRTHSPGHGRQGQAADRRPAHLRARRQLLGRHAVSPGRQRAGTDDADAVVKTLENHAFEDVIAKNGKVRAEDHRMIHDVYLAQQLREFEADGIIRRTVFEETPPRVEYELTDEGVALYTALGTLGEWASAASVSRIPVN